LRTSPVFWGIHYKNRMTKKIILLSVSVFLQSTLFAQGTIQKVEQAYNQLLTDSQAKHALISLSVMDASTGSVLFARNDNIGVATASTLKTITSATAFGLLGKDFRYQTTLAYSGSIENGVLKGSLIILGGGDPTLGSWRYEATKEGHVLNQWVQAIKVAGIKEIDGNVIGDDSAWDTQNTPESWIWQDIGNYYGAGPSALSWRENQFDIHLKSSGSGVNISKIVPEMPYLRLVNELKAGSPGTGDRAYVFLPPLAQLGYLRGTWAIGIGKPGISAALPDPAFDAAYRLQDTLKRLGINSKRESSTARILAADKKVMPAVSQKLITVNSPSLSEMIYWFNKKSINLYGEHFLRTIAWKSGQVASTKNGVSAEQKYWEGKGIDRGSLNIVDGSGLSPGTRVTTLAMARILFLAQKESWYPDYLRSFPENNGMQLKSGSINDVSAYAGYYTNSNGKKYIMVININNYSGSGISKKLFKVLDALK
jgi:D-alanyl-D-alanine carboxypeptidase/D-alanyl-D-alanine-endopeptidase (penicillin-binding protein 4)